VRIAGWTIGIALALLYRTLRLTVVDPGERVRRRREGERAIYAFWHDALALMPLLVTRVYPDAQAVVMLSWHRDAEIAAQAMRRFGVRAVRGSSRRGWLGGLRGLLEANARGDDIGVVPDGPRGPRHRAKDGVVQLARATGLPIVAIGAAAHPARRLGSWDRLQLPRPFARVALVMSEPVPVDGSPVEAQARLQAALERVDALALSTVGAPAW
jgi:lysophospholipid acyltransferase (LPLAT)-like uncharacterized protein